MGLCGGMFKDTSAEWTGVTIIITLTVNSNNEFRNFICHSFDVWPHTWIFWLEINNERIGSDVQQWKGEAVIINSLNEPASDIACILTNIY